MTRAVRRFFLYAVCICSAIDGWNWLLAPALARNAPALDYANPADENSSTPMKVKLSGFINTKPDEKSLAVLKLSIAMYRETYLFEVVKFEAVDRERVTTRALLENTEEHEVAFELAGPKELLSKVAQAEPGTPLALTGFLQQRERRIQLTDVEVIGLGK